MLPLCGGVGRVLGVVVFGKSDICENDVVVLGDPFGGVCFCSEKGRFHASNKSNI